MERGLVPSDFLIVTALPKERDACLERLHGRRELSVAGYTIHAGMIGRLTVSVALADRMGNVNAATVTTALILALRPRNVLLVGIAAGLRKQSKDPADADSRSLGDVLIADQVVDYESAKMGASTVERRPFGHPAAAQLIRAAHELRPDDWNVDVRVQRPPDRSGRQKPRELTGTVLSGNKVVADAAFADQVRQISPAAIGLEMEGFGVASACHQATPPVSFLLIKGICDFADEHKSDDWQPYAANVAAAFAAALIKRMAAMPGLPDLESPKIAGDVSYPATGASAELAATGSSTAFDDSRRSVSLSGEKTPWIPADEMFASSLVQETGPPTDVTTPVSVEPPRLPAPHISRSTTFSALAYELTANGTVAVIGYSKSGKTSLLAEFVRGYPCRCVWLNVERPPTTGEEWWDLVVLQLAGHYELSEATPFAIGEHLLAEVEKQPVIVVIDDAHLLPNLDGHSILRPSGSGEQWSTQGHIGRRGRACIRRSDALTSHFDMARSWIHAR
jgi:nucleoside phosphorylase